MRRFDRVRMGCGNPLDSTVYEVFDPPFWRIDRWIAWLLTRKGVAKAFLTIAGRRVRARALPLHNAS